jgi:formate dehydrogenase subunit beta
MNTFWEIETNGKPLETVQNLLKTVWRDLQFDHMMLPLKKGKNGDWRKEVIISSDELARSNPFTPIMIENIAQFVPEFIQQHQDKKLAVLLRPCEMRAMQKILDKLNVQTKNIIFVSADCLGTFPEDEFSWRANRKGSQENLANESIRFSRQGGIAPYRYRAACQLCENPIANQADINVNIVGVPVRQKILVSIPNGKAGNINFASLSGTHADNELIQQHKDTSEKMIYRNEQTQNRLAEVLVENTNLNIESLVDQLNECGECTNCMDVCPICTTSHFTRNPDGSISRDTVAEWMISCVGCGMCEQACSQHKPLAVLFSIINEQLDEINSSVIN